jgi:hypothetical protein
MTMLIEEGAKVGNNNIGCIASRLIEAKKKARFVSYTVPQ